MKFLAAFLILSSFTFASASCWNDVLPGQYGKILDCSYSDWKNHPNDATLHPLLQNLFYVYFTDGTNKTMKKIFEEERKDTPLASALTAFRKKLIEQYEPLSTTDQETSSIGGLPQTDAALLFILTQTNPQSFSPQLARRVFNTVYRQIEALFVLYLATNRQFGELPSSEYLRMLEILKRMSWITDPFLKATNHYFQGIVLLHLHDANNGGVLIEQARGEFLQCLETAKSQLAKKHILYRIADTDLVIGKDEEAATSFISILKMDPQDWEALLGLSKILYNTGHCQDAGVWVEASITSKEKEYQLTIHCGNKELPEEEFDDGVPAIAMNNSPPYEGEGIP